MSPDWVPVLISPKGLRLWEAGCTWVEENGSVRIQLHPNRRLSLQPQVLAHEVVHAVRGAFEEPRFEEILAYRTSSNVFRRLLGPFFQKSSEIRLFLLASLADILQVGFGIWPCATLLISLGYGVRLGWNQRRFSRCLRNLPNPQLAIALTDREIIRLAKGEPFSQLDDDSPRWQMIKSCAALPLEGEECRGTS